MLTPPDADIPVPDIDPAAPLEPEDRFDAEDDAARWKVEERLRAETISLEALHDRWVDLHEFVVAGSCNPFLLNELRRIDGVRSLLACRSAASRERYLEQPEDHLGILEPLRPAVMKMRRRTLLGTVIRNLAAIRPMLEPH